MYASPIILVDDDESLLIIYKKIFEMKGFKVIAVANAAEAIDIVKTKQIAVIVTDVIMPGMDGKVLLKKVKNFRPEIEVILLTAEGRIEDAVDTVKSGAFSYFVKPADVESLVLAVKKAYELFEMKLLNASLKQRLEISEKPNRFVGDNSRINDIKKTVNKIRDNNTTILIEGESGTGKEVLANYIHNTSKRKDKPIIWVNCGVLNDNLFESEMFGSEKGAYTGAYKQKKGRFELANEGTIFLDEISEISLNSQVKLLRVLQEKSFERVGGNEPISTDFRLIVATNKDLKEAISEGKFREDLYYRINVLPISIPPLRERTEDIAKLATEFLKEFCIEMKKPIMSISNAIMEALISYKWPGNVRELRNVIERLVTLAIDGELSYGDLPYEISNFDQIGEVKRNEMIGIKDKVKNYERIEIIRVLEINEWNVSKTAKELKIARKNLYKKMHDYDLINSEK